ncbi:TPA: 4a-hydroxytetrahydrobiopterin dehydratase [archaeon]|uniref:4a-hydroxytetrahydrobiopterin dehydratase n=1 Tax=Candidatus Naiadarchaeum limnaeum TaxID=2756139 RepID=A0A832V4H2_9ARCH|nr:4a-hydroxytetrahydrobiopterin dehydratase [Candidatus Naiadarchaeum limnaeum]
MSAKILSEGEIKAALAKLPQWSIQNVNRVNLLVKKFGFSGFTTATKFAATIAPIANKMNHHPDLHITNYRNVRVETVTHDVGNKITTNDIELAKKIQAAYDKLSDNAKKFKA